jgi:hypothetical protein
MIRRNLIFLLIASAVFCSCNTDAGPTKLELVLYTPTEQGLNPYEGVGWLRITARDYDYDVLQYTDVPVVNHQAELPGVPYGTRQISVQGHPTDPSTGKIVANVILSRGASPFLEIGDGSTPQKVPVFMIPANAYAQTAAAPSVPGPATAQTRLSNTRLGMTVTEISGGQVVIAGGGLLLTNQTNWEPPEALDQNQFRNTIEIYNHKIGTFTSFDFSPNQRMQHPRAFHTAVKLSDNRVAFMGGFSTINNAVQSIRSIEIFDPVTGMVSHAGDMTVDRALHTTTPIPGRTDQFLIVGGTGSAAQTWEVWSATQGVIRSGTLQAGRWGHTATAYVDNNAIFVIGGENTGGMAQIIEVYRTQAEGFDAVTIPMTVITASGQHYMHRSFHSANFVPERKYIYLVGGFGPTNHSELQSKIGVFSVSDENFVSGAVGFNAETARVAHTATTLENNQVLISGGMTLQGSNFTALTSGEMIFEHWDPQLQQSAIKVGTADTLPQARFFHQSITMETGQALIIGGEAPITGGTGYTGVYPGLLFNP